MDFVHLFANLHNNVCEPIDIKFYYGPYTPLHVFHFVYRFPLTVHKDNYQ